MSSISAFVKYNRKKMSLTQKELAEKAGVGLRFIREMEQGKETLQMDKVNQVLSLFGFELLPEKQRIDPYEIFQKYVNKAVKIRLIDNTVKYGIIIEEILSKEDQKINAWKFMSNKNALMHRQKHDKDFEEIIEHHTIQEIENQ